MYTRLNSPNKCLKFSLKNLKNNARTIVANANSAVNNSNNNNYSLNNLNENIIDKEKINGSIEEEFKLRTNIECENNLSNDYTNFLLKKSKIQNLSKYEVKDNRSEYIDECYISYLKSTFQNYENELANQKNGTKRYFDMNDNYSHLKDFIAFDIEYWWAERSISLMMNTNLIK